MADSRFEKRRDLKGMVSHVRIRDSAGCISGSSRGPRGSKIQPKIRRTWPPFLPGQKLSPPPQPSLLDERKIPGPFGTRHRRNNSGVPRRFFPPRFTDFMKATSMPKFHCLLTPLTFSSGLSNGKCQWQRWNASFHRLVSFTTRVPTANSNRQLV